MPFPFKQLAKRLTSNTARAAAGGVASNVPGPQVGGIRRQLHLTFGAPGPSKYLAPDEDTLRGYLRQLVAKPKETLTSGMREATNLQKGMIAAGVGMEVPGAVQGSGEERGSSIGRMVGSGVGALTFRKAPLMPDLIGNVALGTLGSAVGKALAGVGG